MESRASKLSSLCFVLVLVACGATEEQKEPPKEEPAGRPYATLAAYELFADPVAQRPAEGVVRYEVRSPLFSDYTSKYRFIALPKGEKIGYRDDAPWDFPKGTILVKTFSMPKDLRDRSLGVRHLETRLLIHEDEGWVSHTYVWNEAQTEARRTVAGARVPVDFIDLHGEPKSLRYIVPNTTECTTCHGSVQRPIGPRTRQLDRSADFGDGEVNQIDHYASLGLFAAATTAAPDRPRLPEPFGDGTVEERARAYLEGNCAHCHSATGAAQSSGLKLTWETENPADLGVCRRPFAAGGATGGRAHDIVPGRPDESILIYRLESNVPEVKMPELPNQLVDEAGVALIREWIAQMPYLDCRAR